MQQTSRARSAIAVGLLRGSRSGRTWCDPEHSERTNSASLLRAFKSVHLDNTIAETTVGKLWSLDWQAVVLPCSLPGAGMTHRAKAAIRSVRIGRGISDLMSPSPANPLAFAVLGSTLQETSNWRRPVDSFPRVQETDLLLGNARRLRRAFSSRGRNLFELRV